MWYIYDYSFIVTNGYRLEPAKKKKKNETQRLKSGGFQI